MLRNSLTTEECEWIACGLAWVGLRRWLCGAEEGEQARLWFQDQMDVRFGAKTAARHVTPGMARLEAELRGRVGRGTIAVP